MHKKSKPRRRRILGIPVIGVALFAIPAVALALVTWTLFLEGTINTGDAGVKYSTGAGVTVNSGDCEGSYSDDQTLDLTWADPLPFPEDECEIVVVFAADSNTVAMKLQGASTPAGLNVSVLPDCGKEITVGMTATPAVLVVLEIDTAHPMGTPIALTAESFGFEWVPSTQYVAANCT